MGVATVNIFLLTLIYEQHKECLEYIWISFELWFRGFQEYSLYCLEKSGRCHCEWKCCFLACSSFHLLTSHIYSLVYKILEQCVIQFSAELISNTIWPAYKLVQAQFLWIQTWGTLFPAAGKGDRIKAVVMVVTRAPMLSHQDEREYLKRRFT